MLRLGRAKSGKRRIRPCSCNLSVVGGPVDVGHVVQGNSEQVRLRQQRLRAGRGGLGFGDALLQLSDLLVRQRCCACLLQCRETLGLQRHLDLRTLLRHALLGRSHRRPGFGDRFQRVGQHEEMFAPRADVGELTPPGDQAAFALR